MLTSLGIFGTGTGAVCLGVLEGGAYRREGGKEGKKETREGRKQEQRLLFIDGLWLPDIIHYLGQSPELIYVRQRVWYPKAPQTVRERQKTKPIIQMEPVQARHLIL